VETTEQPTTPREILVPSATLRYNACMPPGGYRSRRSFALWVCLILFAWIVIASPASARLDNEKSSSQSQSDPDKSSDSAKKDKNAEPATVKLKITVTDPHDKPVGNASVYVRFNETVGITHKDKLVEMNLKTNEDGTVKVPEIPQGKILIQVIAKGWHTYGKWYDIEKPEDTVQIKLEPPPHWY
jgi:hypothetical protein